MSSASLVLNSSLIVSAKNLAACLEVVCDLYAFRKALFWRAIRIPEIRRLRCDSLTFLLCRVSFRVRV